MSHSTSRLLALAILAAVQAGGSGAHAANGAYAVDAADISDLGSCKLESWLATATNSDFSAVANPCQRRKIPGPLNRRNYRFNFHRPRDVRLSTFP